MLFRAGAVSLSLLLASRVLGLLRESAQAAVFGASGMGDVAVLMFTLPDWLTGLVAAGALSYVLVPRWSRQAPAQIARTQRQVAQLLLLLGAAVALAMCVARVPALGMLAGGLPASLRPAAAQALVWSALALPPALLAALWITRLQHERDFVGMYGGSLVVNGALVTGLAVLALHAPAWDAVAVLGMWLVAAMLLRLAWLYRRLPRGAAQVDAPLPDSIHDGLPALSVWAWAALSAGLPLALPFVARSIASQDGEGALVVFNYAWKMVELPLVLAVQLVASLAFPSVARAFAAKDSPAPAVRNAFLLAWSLACAAAAGLWVAAPAVARLLYGWGRMSPQDVIRIAEWGRAAAPGLLPQAVIAVAVTVLASAGRMRPVVLAYGTALALLLACGAVLQGGATLMGMLDVLLLGVAVLLAASVRGVPALAGQAWLPVRGMAVSAMLLACAGGVAFALPMAEGAQGTAALLVVGMLLAALVLAGGLWAGGWSHRGSNR
jgi:peptidoglycan biosynthesis protein MviN/MurJ (putative lipid II flippase)